MAAASTACPPINLQARSMASFFMPHTKPQVYLESQPWVVVGRLATQNNEEMKNANTLQGRIISRMKEVKIKGKMVRNVDIANATGVSEQAVGKWLKTGDIHRDNLPGIAKLLKTTVDWLLTGEGRPDLNNSEEREWVETYLALTLDQRRTMKAAVDAIAQSNTPKRFVGDE